MKLLDLSQPVFDGCPNCPVHPRVQARITASHQRDNWHMEELSLASHTGSHIDAPLHKIAGGKSISDYPLQSFVATAVVADFRNISPDTPIDAKLLDSHIHTSIEDAVVLLATGWGDQRASDDNWHFHSPYLSPDGAAWLVSKKARAVGIDHYSIGGSRDPDNCRTHEIILGAGLWVLEDLRFPEEIFALAASQPLQLWALPINFSGFSGSFCRPVIALS
ncbi:Kynurenine formamidase [Verrucomicrobia bacterium LW23]|nr:Kynurenine formamidase [Verrucomicrobia bacterium LW23]